MTDERLDVKALHGYRIPSDEQGHHVDVDIHVERTLRADNLNLQTWGSSVILASQLHKIPVDLAALPSDGIQVLELGAGTALVGLSAAAVWQASVVLTDVEGVVPGIERNVEANRELLLSKGATARYGTLDWRHPAELKIWQNGIGDQPRTLSCRREKAGIILLADIIYDEDHPRLLLQTISLWLWRGPQARVIIACPQRSAYLEYLTAFWNGLEELGMEVIQEGLAKTEDKFDDENTHEWAVFRWKQ